MWIMNNYEIYNETYHVQLPREFSGSCYPIHPKARVASWPPPVRTRVDGVRWPLRHDNRCLTVWPSWRILAHWDQNFQALDNTVSLIVQTRIKYDIIKCWKMSWGPRVLHFRFKSSLKAFESTFWILLDWSAPEMTLSMLAKSWKKFKLVSRGSSGPKDRFSETPLVDEL